MYIRKLVLHKVACFDHAEFNFQPGRDPKKADIHILVGPNGTGKSTVLMALAQIFTQQLIGIEKRLRGANSHVIVEFDSFPTCALGFASRQKIEWNGQDLVPRHGYGGNFSFFEGPPVNGSSVADQTRLFSQYSPSNPEFRNAKFSFAAFAFSGQRSVESYQLNAIQELSDPPLALASSFSSTGNPSQLVQWIANNKAKEAFALTKGNADKAEQRRQSIARIENAIRDIIGKPFAFEMDDDPLKVSAIVDGQQLELDVLPDGMKSIISWVADLLMRMDRVPWESDIPVLQRSFLLFLDEIEIHLHPAWQRKVLPTVQKLFPNAQVFISTHSPFIIASADDAWIYPLHDGPNGAELGEPLASMVGNSYATVLRDALGIDAEFAPQVEEKLNAFYGLRHEVLAGSATLDELRNKAQELSSLGEEVHAIVQPELKQVERQLSAASAGG